MHRFASPGRNGRTTRDFVPRNPMRSDYFACHRASIENPRHPGFEPWAEGLETLVGLQKALAATNKPWRRVVGAAEGAPPVDGVLVRGDKIRVAVALAQTLPADQVLCSWVAFSVAIRSANAVELGFPKQTMHETFSVAERAEIWRENQRAAPPIIVPITEPGVTVHSFELLSPSFLRIPTTTNPVPVTIRVMMSAYDASGDVIYSRLRGTCPVVLFTKQRSTGGPAFHPDAPGVGYTVTPAYRDTVSQWRCLCPRGPCGCAHVQRFEHVAGPVRR
mgnify:CR=1 FL=1